MSKPRSFTLIAPHIAPALARAMTERDARWPQLTRLAGLGSIEQLEYAQRVEGAHAIRPWQRALLKALDLQDAAAQYPSAAVTRCGDVGERVGGFWMHAEAMHFSAGLDHLAATSLQGEGRITPDERTQLQPTLAAHLRASNLELCRTMNDEWLVRTERALDVRTVSPEAAVSQPLDEAMPKGRDAAQLRRLMTELQMLLHEHPVNLLRARRGLPDINAVWLWGEGSLTQSERKTLPAAFGDELYLRGIYRLNDQKVAPAVDAAAALAHPVSRTVAVSDATDLDALETRWIAPLSRALSAGVIAHLELVLDRWRIAVSRSGCWRFWRKERPLVEWGAC